MVNHWMNETHIQFNLLGRLLRRLLNFSQGLSIVSSTFKQNINLVYDLVFVLITGPLCLTDISPGSNLDFFLECRVAAKKVVSKRK